MKAITINNQNVTIKGYKSNRVITFKDIDCVHSRPEGTAKRNFGKNRTHFIENEDFYIVKPSDIQKNEIRTSEINNRGTVLLTESGYLMLAKSFTDDLAWQVQRQLVKSYFRLKEETINNNYEQLKLEDKPYEYFDKHYNGFPVMTLADIEHFTKIPKRTIQYFLDTKTTKGLDYLVIGKSDLAKFKMDNLKINMGMSHLTIVFKSGFDILTKIARLTADVECFKAIEAPAKIEKSPKWLYVDIDNSKALKEQIKKARKHIDTFDTILSKLEIKSMEEGKFKSIARTVNALALELSLELMYINSKEYVTTAEYIEG